MPRDAPRRPETLEMNLDRRYIVNLAAAKRQPMEISPPLTYRHINLAPDNVLFAPDKVNFAGSTYDFARDNVDSAPHQGNLVPDKGERRLRRSRCSRCPEMPRDATRRSRCSEIVLRDPSSRTAGRASDRFFYATLLQLEETFDTDGTRSSCGTNHRPHMRRGISQLHGSFVLKRRSRSDSPRQSAPRWQVWRRGSR